MDIGQFALVASGDIAVHRAIDAITPTGAIVDGGTELQLDVIILATGYNRALDTLLPQHVLDDVYDEHGGIAVSGKPVPGHERLYFCGFDDFLGRLFQIRLEALAIAASIQAQCSQV